MKHTYTLSKWLGLAGLLTTPMTAQTPIVWEYVTSPEAQTLWETHRDSADYVLVAGSGPSNNRLDHFYLSHYMEGRGAMPTTSMEDVVADYNYRINCAADVMLRGIDRSADTGGLVNNQPLLEHIYARYSPFMKVWKLDSVRVDWPMYDDADHKAMHTPVKERLGVEYWGLGDHNWGVTGAGAAGIWANAKICSTPYVSDSGSDWAWVHEGTHAHHKLGHGNNLRDFKLDHIDGEGKTLTRNATYGPTGGLWGQWHGYMGKGREMPETYDGVISLFPSGSLIKDNRASYMDLNKDNANHTENRTDNVIHDYYKAFDPIDSHTLNTYPLNDPQSLQVNVASTDVILIRWFVNGTEVLAQRGSQTLDIGALDLAAGQYRITAEAYDSAVDYAFSGDANLDLVRYEYEQLCDKVGWMVHITGGGSNDYLQRATLVQADGGTLSGGSFNTGTGGKIAVLPYTQQAVTLAGSSSLSMDGLRIEGDYILSGGELSLATGGIHSLPNSHSVIGSNMTFAGGLSKTGHGQVELSGSNSIGSGEIEVQEGTLVAGSAGAFGVDSNLTIRRGAEVKINGGVTLANTTMEGFSALWCDSGEEVATVNNLSLNRMGNSSIGYQFHGYLKIGTGSLLIGGDSTLSNSVLVLTGDRASGNFDMTNESDVITSRRHWFTDMGRGGRFIIADNLSGRGSIVCKHGGELRITGDVDLQGDCDEREYFNGMMVLMYGSQLVVDSSGSLSADTVSIDPVSSLEYNASVPLTARIIPPHMTRYPEDETFDFNGFFGTLGGTGDIATQVVMRYGSTVTPGVSGQVGRQNFTAGMFVDNMANYHWQLGDAGAAVDVDGLPTGWDVIKVTGDLDLNGVVPSSLWIDTKGREVSEPADELVDMAIHLSDFGKSLVEMNFDPTQSQSFVIIEADTVTGFSADKFTVSLDSDSTLATLGGTWSVELHNGNQIVLVYQPGEGSNTAPVWASTNIDLEAAIEGQPYTASLAEYASDSDGQPLYFEKVSGPSWLTLAADGSVSGVPEAGDIGTGVFVVSMTDGIESALSATLNIEVFSNELAFKSETLDYGRVRLGADITGDLTSDIIAPSSYTVTLVSGPDWLSVSADGTLSGRPSVSDLGSNTWQLMLSDGSESDTTTLTMFVFDAAPIVLSNASFEDPALSTGALSNDIVGWYDGVGYTYTQDDSSGAGIHPDTPYGDNWAELGRGRWIYQQIGTYEENIDVTVQYLLGAKSGTGATTTYVELYAGGDAGLAADSNVKWGASNPLTDTVGATLVAVSDAIPAPSTTQEVSVSLNTGSGHTPGDPLWLVIYCIDSSSRTLIDNVRVSYEAPQVRPLFFASPVILAPASEGANYTGTLSGSASDDNGDSLSFSKVSGPAWLMVASDGTLSGVPLHADIEPNSWTIEVADGNGGTDLAELQVEVLSTNGTPVADDAVFVVSEGADIGTVLGSVSASDPDLTDTLVYAITVGDSAFAIDAMSGEIVVVGVLDYEEDQQHVLTVSATDGEGASDTATITVHLSDVTGDDSDGDGLDDAWELAHFGNTSAQEASGDADADGFSNEMEQQLGTNPVDAAEPNRFTDAGMTVGNICDPANWSGGVLPTSGVGYITGDAVWWKGEDLNDPGTGSSTADNNILNGYHLIVTGGTLGRNVSFIPEFTDCIIDLQGGSLSNDGPGGRVFRISGDTVITVGPGSLLETDSDNDRIEYQADGVGQAAIVLDGGAVEIGTFSVSSDPVPYAFLNVVGGGSVTTSEISINVTGPYVNFVTGSTGTLTVSGADSAYYQSMWDAGNLRLDDANAVAFAAYFQVNGSTLSLRSVPLDPPVLDDTSLALDENAVAGTMLGTLVTAGSTGTLSWSLSDDAGGLFAINESTGEITSTAAVDFEFAVAYTLVASVSDESSLTDTATVTVNINDVNEAPTAVDTNGSVTENSSAGELVATVIASDPDANESLVYAIVAGNTGGAFTIDASGKITTTGPLDFELENHYSLTVAVTDLGGLSDSVTVAVAVIDENEAPSIVDAATSLAEDLVVGASVLMLSATDVDAGDSLTYALTSGSGFAVNSTTGEITTTAALDYETEVQHVLTVSVTDSGGLSSMATVTIDVSDVNEAPVLDDASTSLAEDVGVGTSVLMLAGSDVDDGDSLVYAITSGTGFAVNSATGEITSATALDYETLSQHVLTVSVTDSGGLSDTATVIIDVTDVVELPEIVTGAASNLEMESAEVAYTLSEDGGESSSVTLYYGESDGGADAVSWTNSMDLGNKTVGTYSSSLSGLTENTTYYYTLRVSNSAGDGWGASGSFTTVADTSPKLVRATVNNVSSDSWTSVHLGKNYTSAVIVATPIYPDSNQVPVVTRIKNASGSSFDLKLDRCDGLSDPVSLDVSVVAVEEGVYTQAVDGVTMEAVKFTSTVTARKNGWVAESRTYQNAYTTPVVLGQVMSYNDSGWSVFWSMGSSVSNPADSNNLSVGKHVGEDPDTTRANETLAYIVIESGTGTINDIAYEAGVGSDIVEHVGETSTGWTYSLSGNLTSASAAALTIAGMDGSDGAWALLYGPSPYTTSSLTIAVDEDLMSDTERKRTHEQVGYLVFE